MSQLFSWQVPHCDALERALLRHNVAIDASDLGTGKTICAVETARRLGQTLVVTCKKIMKPVWAHWMEEWGIDGVVGNWELARRRGLPAVPGALYVFDEVHEASGYKTLNAKLLINTYEAGYPTLMLSATAIESPLKMWALGYLLGFHNLKDFYRWGFKNGVERNYGYPGFHFNGSAKVLGRIHSHVFPDWGSRMRKVLIPDFPECQTSVEVVDCTGDGKSPLLAPWMMRIAKREEESEFKHRAERLEDEEDPFSMSGGGILPELLYARMRAECMKVPALIEMANEGLSENYSVVIFVNFLDTLEALKGLSFPEAGVISGQQKIEERERVISRFQKDECRVILTTIDSGGASVSLHDVTGRHPRLGLVCPTWRAVTLRQALGRVHRAGGRSKALQKLVYAADTIEERVAARVREKLGQIDLINDSDLNEADFMTA